MQGARLRASGHVEIEGFLPNSILLVSGYRTGSQAEKGPEEEAQQLMGVIEASLVKFLHQTFPLVEITVSPPTILQ